ncbi:DUF2207 domain-containing protein [Pannonibacter tanglangensis]|uniref:DUF2207 domain-containing protein n=1 Tax=Pannonibacter tanglangensis TaxID=2750084 RepID=A0ABW9ZI42_9HYPH|nr:DUF2207 domain-containing protein [Pannonibacter sp. XCT-34]NBN64368.1 DUF2207 domain-containing protein [Pannonibacter sp. XCT-34]
MRFPPAPRLATVLAVLLLLLGTLQPLAAAERILRFTSTIAASADGTLRITEVIEVQAEGREIRRGIYRDVPLLFEMEGGRIARAGFELVSVQRNGADEPHQVTSSDSGVRILIGQEEVFLPAGRHTYRIVYDTTRQIRFFGDADEIYWNATGNEWAFPIEQATARVVLPEGASALDWTAYTGPYGADGADYTAYVEDGGKALVFSATRPLAAGEGLTVAVGLDKGVIAPPSDADELLYFLADYRNEIFGGTGLALVLAFYVITWWRVGRDPEPGVVFPRFEPPKGLSPALVHYIEHRGFSDGGWRALTAACLNLAVKGRLRLDTSGDALRLEALPGAASARDDLARNEAVTLKWLTGRGGDVTISKSNGAAVLKLGQLFRASVERDGQDAYFRENTGFLVIGVVLSVLTVASIIFFGRVGDLDMILLVPVAMGAFLVSAVSVTLGKALRRRARLRTRLSAVFLSFAVGAAVYVGIGHVSLSMLTDAPLLPLLAALLLAVNFLFFKLMGAPTALGRQVLDEIEGLRLYLEVAEAERMNMEGAPLMSPEHFETLLPYAVALEVEEPWSRAFEVWLATAAGAGAAAAYQPHWTSGMLDAGSVARDLGHTVEAMSSSFTSALPAPETSSSGSSGGGFSGGGGGGGGGGGW